MAMVEYLILYRQA